MSQMNQYYDPWRRSTSRMSLTDMEAEAASRAVGWDAFRTDYSPSSLTSNYEPTPYEESSRGFLSAVSNRWNRGSGYLGDAWWAKTGMQVVNDLFDPRIDPIGAVHAGKLHYMGNEIDIEKATARQVLETADSSMISFYKANGLSVDDIVSRVDDDPIALQKFHREFLEFNRNNMLLENYAEEHGISYFGTGVVAFLGDAITDPINLLSLGAGSLASSAGRAGARAVGTKVLGGISRAVGPKNTNAIRGVAQNLANRSNRFIQTLTNGSPIMAVVEAATPIQRTWAKRVFMGSISAEAMGMDVVSQMAENETAVRFALAEEDDLHWNPFRTAFAGLAGLALASIGARSLNLRKVEGTARNYIQHNSAHPVSSFLADAIDRGTIAPDAPLRYDTISHLEGIYGYARGNFSPERAVEIENLIDDSVRGRHESSIGYLADFISKKPSEAELRAELATKRYMRVRNKKTGRMTTVDDADAVPAYKTPGTAYWDAKVRVEELQTLRGVARQNRDIKALGQASRELRGAMRDLEEAKNAFRDNTTWQNDPKIPQNVKEWLKDDKDAPLMDDTPADPASAQNRAYHVISKAIVNDKFLGFIPSTVVQRLLRWATVYDKTKAVNRFIPDGEIKSSKLRGLYAALHASLDDAGLNAYVRNQSGAQVMSTYKRMQRIRGVRTELLKHIEKEFGTKNEVSSELADSVGREVLQAMIFSNKSVDPKYKNIASSLREYMTDMAMRGESAGVLRNLLENYLPIKIYRSEAIQKADQLVDLLTNFWTKKFRPGENGNWNPDLHRGVLVETGLAERMDNGQLKMWTDSYDKRPLTFMQLDEEDRKMYLQFFEDNPDYFRETAKAAIQKKLNIADEDDGRFVTYERNSAMVDVAQGRKLDQEFWYSDEVLDLGVVDTNIGRATEEYERIVGYRIAQQETLNEMFGEVVTFDQALKVLEQLGRVSGEADTAKTMVSSLRDLDSIASMRKRTAGEASKFFEIANSFARAVTFGTVPMTILATEGSVAIARAIGSGNLKRMSRAFDLLAHNQSREDLRRMGMAMELEWDSSRQFGYVSDLHGDQNLGKFRGFMRMTENAVREYGGESFITRRLKVLHYYMSSSIMHKYRNKLDAVFQLDSSKYDLSTKDGLKAFKAEARRLGFGDRYDHAEVLTRMGVISKETEAGIRALKAKDPDLLLDPIAMREAALQIEDKATRESAELFLERLSTYAIDDMESFVTTASPNSMHRSDNALANAFLMYTTFPYAFVQRSMSRAFRSPASKQWGYMSVYAFGEMMSYMLRRIVINNEDAEDVRRDMLENPLQNAAGFLLRSPITGPYNPIGDIAFGAFAQDAFPSFSGAAGAGRFIAAGKAAINFMRAPFTEEGMQQEDVVRLSNNLPGFQMWHFRTGLELIAGRGDDEEDRAVYELLKQFDPEGALIPPKEINKMLNREN